ncbi:MAG: glutamate synthase (NADPH), homotetrameric [Bryobacteraceae bacterium]|nr:MAG: glutamate synthase (NADPH), homotetrameric [Bryobacteraceae bacterium]
MPAPPPKHKPNPKLPRQPLPLLDPERRRRTADEVALGYTAEQAQLEAQRCLQCQKPVCAEACPLHIDIKRFILRIVEGDFQGAHDVISEQSPFPGVCGRVCQHELFCESACVVGKRWDPVAIGSLERFAADHARLRMKELADSYPKPTGKKVALVGSGPASLIAAYDLVRLNYRVTVFEALHQLGGVMAYGIPNFRLPREILHEEIARLQNMGVEFVPDFIVGKTATIEDLFEEGYEAIFIGTGAGLPYLMGIPGENLIGVYTANEFLTRVNLMEAYKFPESPTPVRVGRHTVVVGGGNSAMDAARWAVRLGSDVTILYRRGRAELKARLEEIEHAEEEGVRFEFLAAPVALYGDENGYVREMECIRMELGEPDESGRRAPVPVPGSEFRIPAETVIAAIGQAPNPTLQKSTPQLVTRRGKIVINEWGETSIPKVFAGGDVVRGGSTVILAMKDGRAAARAIHEALSGAREAREEVKA